MLTCDRTYSLLSALEKGQLDAGGIPPTTLTAELGELEKTGLLLRVSPEIIALGKHVDEMASTLALGATRGDVSPLITELSDRLEKLETTLRSDWHRSFHGAEVLANEAALCVKMRGDLSLLTSHVVQAQLTKANVFLASLSPKRGPLALQSSPDLVSISPRGEMVLREMTAKFKGKPLFEFLKVFDKQQAAMAAFVRDVGLIQQSIGAVPKMREQVVIGLLKSGKPAPQAVAAFQAALGQLGRQAQDPKGKMRPHRAVAAIRNDSHGSPAAVENRLLELGRMLTQQGYPPDPALQGAAKSLLPFTPREGVQRFDAIFRRLRGEVANTSELYKLTARLMSAEGTPDDVVHRAHAAASNLGSIGGRAWGEMNMTAVALGSMVKTAPEVIPLCQKFFGLVKLLVDYRLATVADAPAIALDAITCPGTPAEIVTLIQKLAVNIAHGRPGAEHIKIAAAFAKRFAF